MDKLQYQIYKISTVDFFDEYQQSYENGQSVINKEVNSLFDAYQETYETLLPGVAEDGTIAGMLSVTIPELVKGELLTDISRTLLNKTAEIFGMENIITIYYNEASDSIAYKIFFIPIIRRLPNISKWMNFHKKDTPTDALILKYDDALTQVIPDFTPVIQQEKLTPEEMGYQPALLTYRCHRELKSDKVPMIYKTTDNTSHIQTITPIDTIQRIINETIYDFTIGVERTSFQMAQQKQMDHDKFISLLVEYVTRYHPDLPEQDLKYMLNKFEQWAYGMYVLEPLINDDDISDIFVVNPQTVRVKVKNRRYTSNVKFLNNTDLTMFLHGLALRQQLDLTHRAIHVFSDIHTSDKFRMRINLATEFITSDELPYFHIRKIAKQKRDFKYLLDNHMMDETIMNYLIDRARYGSGMIFTGKGASGKTTCMNALLDKIPFDKSGLVIQESEELFSDVHPHLMFEHITTQAADPNMRYGLEHLARNGLLTDLDYFVIGEIKGAEAADFMMAADTGHKCWCSVHAPSALDAMDKLADYVMSATRYDFATVNKMLSHLGTVVFMKDFQVCEIAEIDRWDSQQQRLIYTPIYLRPGMAHPAFE